MLAPDQYSALSEEFTGGAGFDDIVMLDPRSAETVSDVAKHIMRRGTLNMVGETPLRWFGQYRCWTSSL